MSIEPELVVIVDASGSMAESGKSFIAWNLCNYLLQRIRLGTAPWWLNRMTTVTLGEAINVESPAADSTIEYHSPAGHADLATLSRALESLEEERDAGPLRYLLLSDGRFQREQIPVFAKWIRDKRERQMIAIAVGADADVTALNSIAGKTGVFQAEEIAVAIDVVFERSSQEAAS